MAIIRYTTPTVRFMFSEIDIDDISVAYLTIKQNNNTVIEKDINSAVITNTETEQSVAWKLTQDDTLKLAKNVNALIYCDWKLTDGTRGRSHVRAEGVEDTGMQEVI